MEERSNNYQKPKTVATCQSDPRVVLERREDEFLQGRDVIRLVVLMMVVGIGRWHRLMGGHRCEIGCAKWVREMGCARWAEMKGLWPYDWESWEMERGRRTEKVREGEKLKRCREWEERRKFKIFYWFFKCKNFYSFCLWFFLWSKIFYIWPIILLQN